MTQLVARALIGLCALLSIASLPRIARDVDYEASRARVPERHGIPEPPGFPDGLSELIHAIRERVPPHERILIVHAAGTCRGLPITGGQGAVFWILYHALPRAATCDPDARWRVFLGVPAPGALPAGTRAYRVRPSLALVGP